MQPVITSSIQNSFTTTTRKSSSEQTTKTSNLAPPHNKRQASLPEDIVTLSAPSTMAQEPSKSPTPSTPVINAEREALLKSSAGKTRFSTYA